MGGPSNHGPNDAIDGGLRGQDGVIIPTDVQNAMVPSEALFKLLQQAQGDHRKCLSKAKAEGKNIVDACALTWGNVYIRYQQWAAYRPPFKDYDAASKWSAANEKK